MKNTNQKLVYKNPNLTVVRVALDKGYATSGSGTTDETFIGQEDLL